VNPDAIVPSVLVGAVGGLMVGLTGIGAGTIISTLLLMAYPGVEPRMIVGSATLQAVVMKLAGVLARRQFRLREMRIGLSMAAGAAPLGVVGAVAGHYVPGAVLKAVLAWVLVGVGGMLLAQAVLRRARGAGGAGGGPAGAGVLTGGPAGTGVLTGGPAGAGAGATHGGMSGPATGVDPSPMRVGFSGSLVGFLAGLTSIGTGTLFISMLAGPLRIGAHRAVAAALVAGVLTLLVSGATHAALGHAVGAIVIGTCLGSVPAVVIGTALSHRLPATALRGVIGAAIVVAAVVVLSRVGR
jgi:uncharacterized membrane protein YfcA